MNTFPLLNGHNNITVAHACGKCGTVYSPKIYIGPTADCLARALTCAEECCLPRKCKDCGKENPEQGYWLQCAPCRRAESERKEAKKIAKAKHISLADYKEDYVWIDDRLVGVDDLEDETGVFWAVTTERGIKLNAIDILESACEERHEDAIEDLDVKSLQAVLDAWCAAQNICSYWASNDLIVVTTTRKADE